MRGVSNMKEYKLTYVKDPNPNAGVSLDNVKDKMSPLNFEGEYEVPDFVGPFNQLTIGSCTTNAAMDAFEMLLGIQNPKSVVALSRLFAYWNARELCGTTNVDEGTYIRSVYESVGKFGVCLESQWSYDPLKVFTKPTLAAYRQATDNQLTGFYKITSMDQAKANDIEAAIRFNHVVEVGIPVGSEFMNYDGSNKVLGPPPSSDVKGAHAVLIVGVRNNATEFKLKNSWGLSWGNLGHVWVNYDYIVNFGEDLWTPTIVPNLIF
jgi:C1A family cysteine protease